MQSTFRIDNFKVFFIKIERVFVVGLALDFCVQFTAIDSVKLGYETFVIEDATLPVDIGNSVEETLENFRSNKIKFGKLEKFIQFFPAIF